MSTQIQSGPVVEVPLAESTPTSLSSLPSPPTGPDQISIASGAGVGAGSADSDVRRTTTRPILEIIEAHKADAIRRGNRSKTIDELERYGYESLLAMGEFVEDINRDNYSRVKAKWDAQGMSTDMMNRRIGKMKQITAWASDFGVNLMEQDPLAQLRRIAQKKEKKDKRTFTLEEVRKLLGQAKGTDWHTMLLIYASTGVRKMALLLRKGKDWDGKNGLLTLRVEEGNKVAHEDIIPVGPAASRAIRSKDLAPDDPLFPSSYGKCWSSRSAHNALVSLCKKSGVPLGGFHAIRRCAASEIARRGSSDIASLVLGHMDGKRTLAQARYIQATAEDARQAVEELEAALLEG